MSTHAHDTTTFRRLERPHHGRMISGVAAGVARHLDVDPVIVRIAFVVAACFGGAGFAAYGAAWLLVPAEGAEHAIVNTRSWPRLGVLAGVGLLIAAAATASDAIGDGDGAAWFWTVVFGGAGAWLLARPRGDSAGMASAAAVPRSRAATRVAAGLMLLVAAAIAGVGAADVGLSWQAASGIFVAAAGLVLVAGAFAGVSAWLSIPPLAIAAAVGALGAAGVDFHGPIGERTYQPVTASAMPSEYRMAIGDQKLDLAGLSLPDGTTRVKLRLGIGDQRIYVPDGMRVRVEGHVGAGDIRMPGGKSEGSDVDRDVTLGGTQGPLLVIDAHVGLGELHVMRQGSGG